MLSPGDKLFQIYITWTMAPQRKSYTVHFKLQALQKLEENNGNVSATARDLSILRKQLHK